jgi:O-Antigen ligase
MRGSRGDQGPTRGFALDPAVWALGLAILAAGAVGLSVSISPVLAAALAGATVLLAVVAIYDIFGLAVVLIGTLPWLIVLSDALPRLTLTVAAGATAIVVREVARPRSDGSKEALLLRVGTILFLVPLVASLGRGGGMSEAAKYAVFPLIVMTVSEATNLRDLYRLRSVALWSGAAAVGVNLLLGLTGVANTRYYGSGEILGLGSEHILALLAGSVTAAALASSLSLRWAPVVGVGAIATVATGVRSALPGLALAALVRMVSGRVRFRMIVLVALAVVAVFASGAAHVVEARFHRGETFGEFRSLNAAGSGRGSIYSIAIHAWAHSSPFNWAFGTGLGSILRFSQEKLGSGFVGHSDVVGVGVELGIVGLIGWLLIWRVLIARASSRLPLLVLGSFAIFNGILEYVGPVVIGLVLTTGLTRRHEARAVEAEEPRPYPRAVTSDVAFRGPA